MRRNFKKNPRIEDKDCRFPTYAKKSSYAKGCRCSACKEDKRIRRKKYSKIESINAKNKFLALSKEEQEKVKAKRKQYYENLKKNFPEILKERRRKAAAQRQKNPKAKIASSIRGRMWETIRRGSKSGRTEEILGCTIEEFKKYLESKFKEGMSWENYGRNGWEIDHIIPCNRFNLDCPEEQRKCFHYTNTQPLWWYENKRKGAG